MSWSVSGVLLNTLGQGMVFAFPSVLLPELKSNGSIIRTDLETASWISSVVGLSTFPGFLLAAFLMELWGRKIATIILIIPGTLGWLMIYFANDVTMLLAGRALGGITTASTVNLGAVIIGEYTSPKLRGMFLNLKTAAICLGGTIVHVMGYYCTWRTVSILGAVVQIFAFLIICTWPESPVWLAAKHRYEQSEKAWLWLRGDGEDSRREFNHMIRAQKQKHIQAIHLKSSIKSRTVDFLKKFTKSDFVKPLLIIFFAAVLLEACLRHVFPAYATIIMEEITGDKSKSFYYTLIIDIVTTFSATFSSVLVRMLKRRTLLFLSGGTALIVLAAVCTYLYLASIDVISKDRAWVPISMFLVYFTLANLGCNPIPLALLGELFPVAHRGAGSALSGLILGLSLMVALKIAPSMLVNMKVHGTFAIFGGVMGLCLIALYFTLPETKDRTLQEIEDYFNHGKFVTVHKVRDDEEKTEMLKRSS